MGIATADHSRWANAQVAALVELGTNPVDAQASVDWVLRHLPAHADPATYVFPEHVLVDELTTREVIADARIAFYASDDIPSRYKRILDAKGTT